MASSMKNEPHSIDVSFPSRATLWTRLNAADPTKETGGTLCIQNAYLVVADATGVPIYKVSLDDITEVRINKLSRVRLYTRDEKPISIYLMPYGPAWPSAVGTIAFNNWPGIYEAFMKFEQFRDIFLNLHIPVKGYDSARILKLYKYEKIAYGFLVLIFVLCILALILGLA